MKCIIATVLLAVGCASSPPAELVSARQAYDRARTGPAAQYAPTELAHSRTLLGQAEERYNEYPSSRKVRDLAYASTRQSERAEFLAQNEIAKQDKTRADADLLMAQADIQKKVARSDERASTAEQEASTEAASAAAARARADDEASARTEAEAKLSVERQSRATDAKSRAAIQSLMRVGSVAEDSRGTVISFGTELLFAADGDALRSQANAPLDAVAETILARPDQLVLIECPGEMGGSDQYRGWLANHRGSAIRDYLTKRGVAAERIRVSGVPYGSNVTVIVQR